MDSEWWAAVAAWIAALIAVASTVGTLLLQWWRRPQIAWIGSGWATKTQGRDIDRPGKYTLHLNLANVGDGTAYAVSSLRCVGGGFKPTRSFEAGIMKPGDELEIILLIKPDNWESCWVELEYISSPTRRSERKPKTYHFQPAQELGDPSLRRARHNQRDMDAPKGIPRELVEGSDSEPNTQ